MCTLSQRSGRSAVLVLAWALVASACGSGPVPSSTPTAPAPTATASATSAAGGTITTSPTRSPTPGKTATTQADCVSLRPEYGFYEAGHVGTKQLTTPVSGCTTISVSDIRDPANPQDHCKRFSVGFWPLVNGSLTYTKPADACDGSRTVLARDVPDHTRYIVLYESGPGAPHVEFTVWH